MPMGKRYARSAAQGDGASEEQQVPGRQAARRPARTVLLLAEASRPHGREEIGSHSSTLFPSGSSTHANVPFSSESGPFKMSTPLRFNCSNMSDMLSIR